MPKLHSGRRHPCLTPAPLCSPRPDDTPAPASPRPPRWRVAALGLWLPEDEDAERHALGWALQGERVPRLVEARHFYAPLHGRAACAVLLAGAWEGRATLLGVVRAMRRWRALSPAEAAELGAMYEDAQYVAEPRWERLVERAEMRLRVLECEALAEQLRRDLRGRNRAFT